MKIKIVFLVLALLSVNYLIKAQEEGYISQVCNDIKVEIGKKLLENEGSLTDLFSYLSTDKNFNKLVKNNSLITHINNLNSDQQKEIFKNIIEALKNKQYRDAKINIIKIFQDKGIIKKLVDNILASEFALQDILGYTDILDYFPMDKELDIYIKKNGLFNCLQKDIEAYIKKNNLLEMAAGEGHEYIVELLLKEEDINPIAKNFALKGSARSGHKDIVELLLKENDINPEDKGSALKYAAKGGHKGIVMLLLKEEDILFKDKADALNIVKNIIERKNQKDTTSIDQI